MKANPDKCHLLLNNSCKKKINIGKFEIESSMQEKLLGITIDNDVNLASHVKNLCENASRKMHALVRISPYMSLTKKRSLLSAFFVSQFNYCPLAWMCHSRTLNNRINKLHERCLHVIYNDKKLTFQKLLDKDKSVSIHNRNLQVLSIEMYKVTKGLSPKVFANTFTPRSQPNYNLRHITCFKMPLVNSVYNGTEIIAFLGPKIWELIPEEVKQKKSLNVFKDTTKK